MARFGVLVFQGLAVDANESRSARFDWLDALRRDLDQLREAGAGPWDLVVIGPRMVTAATDAHFKQLDALIFSLRNIIPFGPNPPDWLLVPRPMEAHGTDGTRISYLDTVSRMPRARYVLAQSDPAEGLDDYGLISHCPKNQAFEVVSLEHTTNRSSAESRHATLRDGTTELRVHPHSLLFASADDVAALPPHVRAAFDLVLSLDADAPHVDGNAVTLPKVPPSSEGASYVALSFDTSTRTVRVWPRHFREGRFSADPRYSLADDASTTFTLSEGRALSTPTPAASSSPTARALPPTDVRGVAPLHALSFGTEETVWMAWSPDGARLAIGSNRGSLSVLRSTDVVWTTPPHDGAICDIVWGKNGASLVSVSRNAIAAQTAASGQVLWRHELPPGGDTCVRLLAGGEALVGGLGWIALATPDSLDQRFTDVEALSANASDHLVAFGARSGVMLVEGTVPLPRSAPRSRPRTGRATRAIDSAVPFTLANTSSAVRDLLWLPGTNRVVLALDDGSIVVREADSETDLHVLEGHRDVVTSVSLSHDGRLLASKSNDGTVRLWRTDEWREVARIDEPMIGSGWYSNAAFSPTTPVLATPGPNNRELRLWEIDIDLLLRESNAPAQVVELCAKVVVVGEGGAGKSSLANRLVEGAYREVPSTHAMQVWRVPAERLDPSAIATRGERREVLLWDLGGQDVYKVLHQLFMRDTTLALLMVDPRREHPLREARFWNTVLTKQSDRHDALPRVLVLTKCDEDAPRDEVALARFVKDRGLVGPIVTSAKTGDGVDALARTLVAHIPWGELTTSVRPALFQRVRDEVEALRSGGRVAMVFREFEAHMRNVLGDAFDGRVVDTVVRHLAVQGHLYDSRMADGERALVLHVEQVERYAGSILLLARTMPRGLPIVDHGRLLVPGAELPKIPQAERLPRCDEMLVVDCVVEQLIRHGVCVLISEALFFPSLFPRAEGEPATLDGYVVSHCYDFRGVDEGVYASLVARLALGGEFGPLRLHPGRAEYTTTDGGTLGVRWTQRDVDSQVARVEVFCNEAITPGRRDLFVTVVEEHLHRHGIDIKPYASVRCANAECNEPFSDDVVHRLLARGATEIQCQLCPARTPLPLGASAIRTVHPTIEDDLKKNHSEEARRRADAALAAKAALIPPPKETAVTPIRILHLSDLHIEAGTDPVELLQPLAQDLRDATGGLGVERLDYLVVSGDITNRATPEEFKAAFEFLKKLMKKFGLSMPRVAIVPGNHDLSWEPRVYEWHDASKVDIAKLAAGSYVKQGDVYLVRDDARYPSRFDNFNTHFYEPLLQTKYPVEPENQGVTFLSDDARLQFLMLNSSWEIDRYHHKRSSIHGSAVTRALDAADDELAAARTAGRLAPGAKPLRIGVWHHPITGNEKIANDAFVELLRTADVRVCMHGHVHEVRSDLVGYTHPARHVHVAGAGSFGAPSKDRPEATPTLYNLIEIDPSMRTAKVHTRGRRRRGGAFEGHAIWPGADPHTYRSFYEIDLGDHGWPAVVPASSAAAPPAAPSI